MKKIAIGLFVFSQMVFSNPITKKYDTLDLKNDEKIYLGKYVQFVDQRYSSKLVFVNTDKEIEFLRIGKEEIKIKTRVGYPRHGNEIFLVTSKDYSCKEKTLTYEMSGKYWFVIEDIE